MTDATLRGMPDAGNPHIRFDEREVALAKPSRGSLLCDKEKSTRNLKMEICVCLLLSVAISFAVLFMENCFRAEWHWVVIIGGWLLVLLVQVLEMVYSLICSLCSRKRYWKCFLTDALLTFLLMVPFYSLWICVQGMMMGMI